MLTFSNTAYLFWPTLAEVFTKPTADWSNVDVKVLLDVYETERSKFKTPGLVCRKLWDEVALKVNSRTGKIFKGCHCENKWVDRTFELQILPDMRYGTIPVILFKINLIDEGKTYLRLDGEYRTTSVYT